MKPQSAYSIMASDLLKTLKQYPEFKKDCDEFLAYEMFQKAIEEGHAPDSEECMKAIRWLAKQRGDEIL